MTAVRASAPVRLDGRLDEADWRRAQTATSFVQVEPSHGQPASDATEVRVLFDAHGIYVAAVCHDAAGAADLRVRDLRRDFDDTTDDFFGVAIDGVGDGRALVFRVNPLGALRDQQTVDGGLVDAEFDAVWEAATTRGPHGWTAEIFLPWPTLRYEAGAAGWQINFQRVVRRTNENTGWSLWPRSTTPFRMDFAGLLRGLEPPPPTRHLRLVPYASAEANRNHASGGPHNSAAMRAGLDAKWAVSPSTVLDVTVWPDFGQADVDRQVINLTRFSPFFPERRPFFLENRGVFFTGNGQRFEPFFSRRIGLDDDGQPLTIIGGARLTARRTEDALGVLAVSQRAPHAGGVASHVGVVRYVRNIGTHHRLGGLLTLRADDNGRENLVGGIDGFWRPTPTSFVRGTLTASATTGTGGEGVGGFIWVASDTNRGYVGYISELVTAGYDARTGFVVRHDYLRVSPAMTLDWRPTWRPSWVRRIQPGFTLEHFIRPSSGRVEEGSISVRPFTLQLQNGGTVQYAWQPNWQRPASFFSPLPGVHIEAGRYDYARHLVTLQSDPSRRLAGRVEFGDGGYFDGRLTSLRTLTQVTPDPRVAVSIDHTVNRLTDIGATSADVTTHLLGVETRLAANPRLQLVHLSQWNTSARHWTATTRFNWEYRPLAYFSLVYSSRAAISGLGLDVPRPASGGQLFVKLTWLSQS